MRPFSIDPLRVERYRATADAAFAAAREANETALQAAEMVMRLKQESRRIQEAGVFQDERERERPDMAERIAAAEVELARLRKAQAASGQRAQHAGRIWTGIAEIAGLGRNFAREFLPGGRVSA